MVDADVVDLTFYRLALEYVRRVESGGEEWEQVKRHAKIGLENIRRGEPAGVWLARHASAGKRIIYATTGMDGGRERRE